MRHRQQGASFAEDGIYIYAFNTGTAISLPKSGFEFATLHQMQNATLEYLSVCQQLFPKMHA
jgi:hypothetical protein